MRSYLLIVTFVIILTNTADCRAVQNHVVYKSIGEKAHLTFKHNTSIHIVKWRKDHYLIGGAENKKSFTRHPEKYHIHALGTSLNILNLTVNDSGYYQAETGQWEDKIIKYNLIVQEAISKPVMDTNLVLESNSSSVCHIWVRCSANGESVTYDCDTLYCMETNVTSTKVNIMINYTDKGVLECTASNRVSTKRTSMQVNNICSDTAPAQPKTITYILGFIIIPSCTVFTVLLLCAIKLYSTRKKKQNEGTYQEDKGVHTVYSVVHKQPKTKTPEVCSAAQNEATVYDVPSKCARAPQGESGDSVQEDDTHTVYWKLGQTQNP